MIEWLSSTSEKIAAADKRLPVIIPVGLVEAHGPHLPLSVDIACAEYFARRAAQETGAILAPGLAYGFADSSGFAVRELASQVMTSLNKS